MTTLTDFLLARITEDEAANVEMWRVGKPYLREGDVFHVTPIGDLSDRWKAECEAKRRMMELHAEPHKWCGGEVFLDPDWPECDTLRLLAVPFADHPDYREEWRP